MNYNQQENSLSKSTNADKKDFLLTNQKGYREIREYMISLIVKDKKEKEAFFCLAKKCYLKNAMQIALDFKDRSLMKETFSELKAIKSISIDEMITYCRLLHSGLVPFLRLCRKIKTVTEKLLHKRADS